MINRIILINLICCFNCFSLAGQVNQDSLKIKLNQAAPKVKIKILIDVANQLQLSNPDTAIILAQEALSQCEQINDTLNKLEAIVLLARSYQNRSEFYKSTNYFFKAVSLAEKWKNYKKLASYHNSIGISYYYLKDYNRAIFHIQKAADLKYQSNEITEYGTIIGNLAGVLHQLGRNKEAKKTLQLAQLKLQGEKNKAILGNLYNTLGSIYQMGEHRLDSAEYCYRKALKLAEHEQAGLYKLTAHANIGMVCNEQNKLDEAAYHLFEALKLSIKIKRDIVRLTVYEALSTNYEKKKDFEKALTYKNCVLDLKDSIFKSDKEAEIAKLEAQYQNEKGKQIIQSQNLEIEKQRNRSLWVVIVLILLLVLIITLIVYFKFQHRIRIQVEKAKETFFADVVHEIRAPISMIKGPIKVLQSKNTERDVEFQLDMAEKNLNKLDDLVNQMLMVNKIDAGQYQVNINFGNFSEFIESLIEPYVAMAQQKGQHFSTNTSISDIYFGFDADAIYKIVSNLLHNAIKYTPEKGQIGIDIIVQNGIIKIVVWDNGIGISEHDQSLVFSRFYRTAKSKELGVKGLGIGLSLVKSLVDALQGSIELQSAETAGCVFTIQLPYQINQLYHNELKSTSKTLILLVEDDYDITDFNKKLLEDNHYNVITALNGALALEILKTQIPDLIITDVMMPVMNGIDLLKEVRAQVTTEHIPVIVLSAKASPLTRNELLKLGAQAYLTKPFLPEELLNVIAGQLLILKRKVDEFRNISDNQTLTTKEKYLGSDPYTQKFFKILFENLDNNEFSVEQFADLMATNRSHFQRKIKSLTGYSPSELIKMVRLEMSKEYLIEKTNNITEVAFKCGFSSQSYFTKSFTQHFGVSPSQFITDSKENN
jgi:two-component system sensor histidine kinase ChiS